MVYKPDNMPIGVYIYQSMQSGIASAAAYSLILIVLMIAVFAAQGFLLRKSRASPF